MSYVHTFVSGANRSMNETHRSTDSCAKFSSSLLVYLLLYTRMITVKAIGVGLKKWIGTHQTLPLHQLAREVLDIAASHVRPGITTDDIDAIVHQATIERNAYPSTLNYCDFPKSVCTYVGLCEL